MNAPLCADGGFLGDFSANGIFRVHKFVWCGLLSVVLLTLAASWASAATYSQLIVFGDSLSDVGNEHIYHGNVNPPYYEGRNSNGRLWVDVLADSLGAPPLAASLASPSGMNFAYGGAEIVNESWAPNLGHQVQTYLNTIPSGGTADPYALYVVWAGSNDFLKTVERTGGFPSVADTANWANNVSNAVATLYANGARHFLVPNLVPLGNVPAMKSLPSASKDYLNSLVRGFNTDLFQDLASLQGMHSDLRLRTLDAYGLLSEVLDDPDKFGFVDTTTPAINVSGIDPNTYLFWDKVHPTAAGHLLLAQAAVPEPCAIGLLAAAALAVLGWRGMRRRSQA